MSDVSVRLTLQEDVSSKLSRVSSAARTSVTQLQQAGQQIDRAFSSNSPEQFASSLGNAMDRAASSMDSLGDSVGQAMEELEQSSAVDFSEGFENAADGADELTRAAEDAGESIDSLSESTESLGDSVDGLGDGDGLDNLGESAEEAGSSMGEAEGKANSLADSLKKLFAVISMAAVLSQVGKYASDAIDIGKDYTAMMSEVQALSGATGSDLALLQNTAREYGATTVFSATEAAEALKYMSLAGWDAQQSSSALGGVLNLAAASGMELGQASDMVTDYLSAFGMQAQDSAYFADMLAHAQANSNTSAAQLGEAYRNSAANLNAAGQDVETVTSMLEAMANQGYKGSEAGTALTAVMRDITNNMEDGSIKIGETSVAVSDAQGNFRDLTDILLDVEKATNGMGEADRAAALGATFTADSTKGLNLMLNEGVENIARYEEALRGSTGAAEDMADTMNDNLNGDMANMNSAFEEMDLQTFEAMEEPMREGVQYLTNTIIPILTEWVPTAFESFASGANKLGNALKPLFETILKNPQAITGALTSLGAGFLAMKTVSTGMNIAKAVTDAGSLTGALGKFAGSLFSNPWAAGAAAAVAAVAAVGVALHEYSEMNIDSNLQAHFGTVELDDSQIKDFASRVINAEWLVNINAALGHFDNAEELVQQAEDALKQNDTLEWRARVGISLTEDEQSTYMSNIETFTTNIEQALSEQTLAAEMTVKEFDIKMADGSSLGSQIEKWAEQDLGDMQYLSAGLTNLVQNALQDGIIDVDEQAAIDELQTKINNIMQGWQEAEAQAEMDVLTQKYGRLSGKDLTDDTFTKVVEEVGKQRETATAALEESEKKLYTTLNALNRPDANGVQRISDSELANYKEQAGYAARNNEAAMLGNSVQFETNTLSDAYGEKLQENYSAIQTNTDNFLKNANTYLQNQDYGALVDSLACGFNASMQSANLYEEIMGSDQAAMQDIYKAMKPDVDSMTGLIDEYREMGQAIPQDVMQAFNDAMMVGAAAGDADAAWQVFASQMVADPANAALVQAIQEGTVNVPDELRTAIERATAETTTDPVTIEGMQADVEDIEVNEDHVQELIDTAFEGLTYVGTTTLDGGEIALQYTVNEGETLSGIMEQYGVVWSEVEQQIREANPEIKDLNLIYPDQVINIPEAIVEAASVDASQVGEAATEAAENETAGTIEEEQQVQNTLTDGGVDGSQVGQAAEQAAKNETGETLKREQPTETTLTNAGVDDSQVTQAAAEKETASEPKEQQVPTTIKFEVASLDDSALASAISEKLKQGEAVPVDVPANVTIKAGTIDSAGLSGEITSQLGEQPAVPVTVPANVTVTAGTIDHTQALASTQEDVLAAFAVPFPTPGTVDVTLAKGTDNIAALYAEVGGLVRSAWASPYSASGVVNVTLTANYSLANPTKTISFGGGATGSATVSASLHALGGIFDEPHFGIVAEAGPESIIPLDGSDRSLSLFEQTGEMLGVLNSGEGKSVEAPVQTVNAPQSLSQPVGSPQTSERVIRLEIGGQGSINVSGSGVSKEKIVDAMMENLRDVFMNIVQQEIIEEGEGAYEF
ncbi:phage tail tape measure protein [Blautia faecis]|uniref:phage tail tape measure protein n=1 Tax=Blautia faecis TaxID=871665 RepID=UPI0028A44243|nr:phage tail tape measure protein [Blautia faecis]MDT4370064.1 phage tail tape measure protein [Blautia faecis]